MSDQQVVALEWMTHDFFESVLEKHESAPITLKKFLLKSATKAGENFASAVYRVVLDYELNGVAKEVSFVMKTSSANSEISEMLENFDVFRSESHFYQNVLKECYKLIDDNKYKLAPSLIFSDNKVIVLEDLNKLGFSLANRKQRLNYDETKLLLEKLAKFHAASAVLYENDPELLQYYMQGPFSGDELTPIHFFFMASMQETIRTVENTPELSQYADQLKSFSETVIERMKTILSRKPTDKIQVLNHGDMWINNVLFTSDRKNAVLVDFQESFYGSPGVDLNHLFYTSADFEVHEKHLDDLLESYTDTLAMTLKKLNYKKKIPSVDDIKLEFISKADNGLILLSSVVPLMLIENTEHADPANFLADTEEALAVRHEVYGNPKFVEILKFMLPRFEKNGVL